MPEKICVLGDGSWGTAIASLLANNGYDVNLWCFNSNIAQSINNEHINNVYFPKIKLDNKIKAFTELNDAVKDVQWIFEAVPIKFLRSVLEQLKFFLNEEQILVVLSKGIEQKTFFLPTQIIDDVILKDFKKCVLSGPSFASELIEKKLTGVDISATDNHLALDLFKIVKNDYFIPEISNDIIGMQVVSALKNVITLALAIIEGYYKSDNAKAFFLLKGLQEISELLVKFNSNSDAIYKLSGIGDLVMSAYGKHSKNYNFGLQIGSGKNLDDIFKNFTVLPEGLNTLQTIYQFILFKNLKLPLIESIYEVIFQKANLDILLKIKYP